MRRKLSPVKIKYLSRSAERFRMLKKCSLFIGNSQPTNENIDNETKIYRLQKVNT